MTCGQGCGEGDCRQVAWVAAPGIPPPDIARFRFRPLSPLLLFRPDDDHEKGPGSWNEGAGLPTGDEATSGGGGRGTAAVNRACGTGEVRGRRAAPQKRRSPNRRGVLRPRPVSISGPSEWGSLGGTARKILPFLPVASPPGAAWGRVDGRRSAFRPARARSKFWSRG